MEQSFVRALFLLLLPGVLPSCAVMANANQGPPPLESLVDEIDGLDGAWGVPYPAHPTPAISGDFNGDGQLDIAWLGVEPGGERWQLFAHFGSTAGAAAFIPLPDFSPDAPIEDVRIFRETPHTYTTWCHRISEECEPDSLVEVDLVNDGIFLAILDSPGFLIYWNVEAGRFERRRVMV